MWQVRYNNAVFCALTDLYREVRYRLEDLKDRARRWHYRYWHDQRPPSFLHSAHHHRPLLCRGRRRQSASPSTDGFCEGGKACSRDADPSAPTLPSFCLLLCHTCCDTVFGVLLTKHEAKKSRPSPNEAHGVYTLDVRRALTGSSGFPPARGSNRADIPRPFEAAQRPHRLDIPPSPDACRWCIDLRHRRAALPQQSPSNATLTNTCGRRLGLNVRGTSICTVVWLPR